MASDAAALSRAKIFVSGKVQAVYYRETTKRKAEALGLTGRAYNLPDGRVEIVAEGAKAKIEELQAWCWKGPEGAAEVGLTDKLTLRRKVTNVETAWEEAAGASRYADFKNGGKKK